MTNYIYTEDIEAVTAALKAVEGKARTRVVGVTDIQTAVANAEKELSALGFTKRDLKDISIVVNPRSNRQPTVNSYGFRADATHVTLVLKTKGWVVESVERRGALSDTTANARDFFFVMPTSLLTEKQATVNARLGLQTTI
jgi:hypothetical protein